MCFFTHFMGGQMYQATAKVETQTLVRDEVSLGQLGLVTMVERSGVSDAQKQLFQGEPLLPGRAERV